MFHDMPQPVLDRMRYLEERDARDRQQGAPGEQRLRQVPAETGRFLALLASSAPQGQFLEIGTSGGYSGLWIALACRERGARLTTFDVLETKVRLAEETFRVAGLEPHVQVVLGDAQQHLAGYRGVRLRQSPEGPIIGALRQGDPVTVLYGREILNGLVWIEVLDGEGRRGWIPEIYTAVVLATSTLTLTP